MKKRLNIGIFNDSFYPGFDGVISVVDNLARNLSVYHNVTVFVPKYPNNKFDDSIFPYKVVRLNSVPGKIIRLDDYPLCLARYNFRYDYLISKENLDIIHVHSPFMTGKLGIEYGRAHNIPVVATMHTQFKEEITKITQNKTVVNFILKNIIVKNFEKCDEVWCVNNGIGKILKSYGYSKNYFVYNNATDFLPILDQKSALDEINKLYGLKADENLLLFVGRITTLKNIFFILDAVKKLKDKNISFKMMYVGDGIDMNKLKAKVKAYNLNDTVILTGKITDKDLLQKVYLRAKLFLFPSTYDASSIVQIEAASQKTPTLFLYGSCTSTTAKEDISGFFSSYNLDSYCSKIEQILSDDSYYQKVQEGCYKHLYVTWKQSVSLMEERYYELITIKKSQLLYTKGAN